MAPFFLVLTIVLIFLIASIRSCYYPYPPQPPKDKRKYISQPYYTVTVGSFGSNASASRRAEELRAERVNNFVLQERGKWLVCVGKYWNVEAANNTVEALANKGIDGEILYPTPP